MPNEQVLKTVEAVSDLVSATPPSVLKEDLHDLFFEYIASCEPMSVAQKTRFTTLYRSLRDFLGRVEKLNLYHIENQ